ncbi:MAG: AAA family ATPase [Syntrophomonadaceae bacterium]
MAVIKELYIKNFRGLNDVIIPIGDKITAIAGQNATGKSTILGMLGQPFNPPNETTTIFGDPFKAKFSNIFKLDKGVKGTVLLTPYAFNTVPRLSPVSLAI